MIACLREMGNYVLKTFHIKIHSKEARRIDGTVLLIGAALKGK